jgi:hypothetical protein
MDIMVGFMVVIFGLVGLCVWRIRRQGFSGATGKRWLLYIFTALLMIGVFGVCYFYAMSEGIGDEQFVKWMNIILTAAFVFGYTLKKFWQLRTRWTFWVELGALLVANFIVMQRLHWETASYFWLIVVIGIPEMFLVFFLMYTMFPTPESP